MNTTFKRALLASLLAGAGFATLAQGMGGPANGMGGPMGGKPCTGMQCGTHQPNTARMQEVHARHLATLKTRLQLTADQEGAWTTFATAMQPPTPMIADHAQFRAEMEKLTTPQRIDKMQALKAQRDAQMAKRADAVKTFYATLNPAQQKVFDLESLQHHGRRGPGGAGGMGMGMMGMDHGMGKGGPYFRH